MTQNARHAFLDAFNVIFIKTIALDAKEQRVLFRIQIQGTYIQQTVHGVSVLIGVRLLQVL